MHQSCGSRLASAPPAKADRIVIEWPWRTDEIKDVAAGKAYTVVEGKGRWRRDDDGPAAVHPPVRQVIAERERAGGQRSGQTCARQPRRVIGTDVPGVPRAPETVGNPCRHGQGDDEHQPPVGCVVERPVCGLPAAEP